MAFGLQLFSPNGQLYFDSGERLMRWHSQYVVTLAPSQTFTQAVANMAPTTHHAFVSQTGPYANRISYSLTISTGSFSLRNDTDLIPVYGTTKFTINIVRF